MPVKARKTTEMTEGKRGQTPFSKDREKGVRGAVEKVPPSEYDREEREFPG